MSFMGQNKQGVSCLQDELSDTREVIELADAVFEFVASRSDRPRLAVASLIMSMGKICGAATLAVESQMDWSTIANEHGFALFDSGWGETFAACERHKGVSMRVDQIGAGMRVEGGAPGTEDYDRGSVIETDPSSTTGHEVRVSWDSGVITWCAASLLRPAPTDG